MRGPGNEVVPRLTFSSSYNIAIFVVEKLRDKPERLKRNLSICLNDYLM